MPIVDRQREREIVEEGLRQGKDEEFIKQAVLRFREQATQPVDIAPPPAPKTETGILPSLRKGVRTFEKGTEATLGRVSKLFGGTAGATFGTIIGQAGEEAKELITGKPSRGVFKKEAKERFTTPGGLAKTIGFTALEALPAGSFGKAIAKVPGGKVFLSKVDDIFKALPRHLQAKATKQFSQALAPTTQRTKTITQRVVPGLLERKTTALTRVGLSKKAKMGLLEAGEQLDVALEGVPKGTRIKIKPIIKRLEDFKQRFTVKGIEIEPLVVKQVDELENIVKQFGDDVDFGSLRRVRQIWDDVVAKSKGFVKKLPEGTAPDIKKAATDSIRNELAKKSPSVAKANAEFSFWKNVDNVISETLERTTGQALPLSQRIAQQAGRIVGFAKGGVVGGILTGEAFKHVVGLTRSTAWRTISAVKKNQLAKLLVEGNIKRINLFIRELLVVAKNIGEE